MRSVPQQPSSNLGRDALGAGQFSGGQGDSQQHQPSSSVRPTLQSSASLPVYPTSNTHAIQAFYNNNTDTTPSASSSMHDLSRAGPAGRGPGHPPPLKSARSTPNVSMRRMDSFPTLMSSLDAGAPPPPPSSGRQKPRVNPLDVQFVRDPSALPMPLTHSPLSRSPLARDEGPMMMMPGMNDTQSVPKALNIVKSPPSPGMIPAIPPRSALRKPPSPAPSASMASSTATSVDGDGLFARDLEKPIMPAANDSRPSSRGSNRNIPSTLRELMAVDEFLCESPVSVPTPPPSLPRASNDSGSRSLSEPEGPVIQTVRAKRDTMTVSPAKKRSLEKKIEAFDKSLQSNGGGVPRSASEPRAERPAPLKVKTVLNHTATVQGPSSAPVAPRQRSESPFGRTPTPLGRARPGVPAAAVGAHGRPNVRGVRRPTINEYGIAPVRPSIDIPERGSTQSSLRSPPDSPILPSSGPLSSISPPDSPILPTEGPLSARSPPDSPILPTFGPLSAGSPPDSPILPSHGPLSAGSPPSSPILPSHGPLSAGSSPPDSPILPSQGPLSAGSPPDSPIIPAEGPLSNPASPPDSPIMPLSGPLAYNHQLASKKDDPRRETLDRSFQFPPRPPSPEKAPQPDPEESLFLPPPMSHMAPPGGMEWPLFAPSIPMPESRAGSPALMMRTQSPVLPIARSQSPAAMPMRAQSPAFSVRAQSPALPAVRSQSPAVLPVRTQSPAVPPIRTQSPAVPPIRTMSPAVPPIRTQSPAGIPIRTQSPAGIPIRTQSPAAMPIRTQSPAGIPVRTQSPAGIPVRTQSPAGMPMRTQSPAAMPVRTQSPFAPAPPPSPFAVPSFSRPWTPTNARPSTPDKRTELGVPMMDNMMPRGPSPSPRGPPPRANTDYPIMRNSPAIRNQPGPRYM